MKKIAILLPIILLFFASGCITGHHSAENLPELNFTTGPAYQYKPSLDGWTLVSETPRLGRMPFKVQDELDEFNIVDAAAWEYERGPENLYVWVKVFDSPEDAVNASKGFKSMFAFDQRTYLSFADQGSVGIYNTLGKEPAPLLIYVVKNNVLIHVAYFNQNGRYSDEKISEDKYFLITLVEDMLKKADNF